MIVKINKNILLTLRNHTYIYTQFDAQNVTNSGRVPFDQNFRKFRFKIEWKRKFPENRLENFRPPLEVVLFWKFWKFPVPFGISTRYESAPVPLAVKSYKMAASLFSRHCMYVCMYVHVIGHSPLGLFRTNANKQ